jgi:hypothetical protein
LRECSRNGDEGSDSERLHFDCGVGFWYYYAEVLSIGRWKTSEIGKDRCIK